MKALARVLLGWVGAAAIIATSNSALAEPDGWFAIGARFGYPAQSDDGIRQLEVYALRHLPWRWQLRSGAAITTRLHVSLGMLRDSDTTGAIAALGPDIEWSSPGGRFVVGTGWSAAWLSESAFADKDLGGPLQFVTHLTLGYVVSKHWRLGYRYQHLSNAGLYDENPGLDSHVATLEYTY